jgi:hypothetical protein
VVDGDVEGRVGGSRPPAEPGQHVGGGVDPVDVEAAPAQLEERVAVAAAELEGGLAGEVDEPGLGLGIGC